MQTHCILHSQLILFVFIVLIIHHQIRMLRPKFRLRKGPSKSKTDRILCRLLIVVGSWEVLYFSLLWSTSWSDVRLVWARVWRLFCCRREGRELQVRLTARCEPINLASKSSARSPTRSRLILVVERRKLTQPPDHILYILALAHLDKAIDFTILRNGGPSFLQSWRNVIIQLHLNLV